MTQMLPSLTPAMLFRHLRCYLDFGWPGVIIHLSQPCFLIPSHPPHQLSLFFSQVAEVHAHCHSDFGDNFRCHLRSSQPLARGFCKCPLHCHVILLPEAPGQPGVANVAVQNGVQPAVYLRNATEQSCLFSCIVFLQGEVQLRHGKVPLLEVWVSLIAYCQIFCIIFQKLLGILPHFPKMLPSQLTCYLDICK